MPLGRRFETLCGTHSRAMNGAVIHPQRLLTAVIPETLMDQPVDAKHRNCRDEPRPHDQGAWPDDPRAGRKSPGFRRLKK
jgi:hypothetical protein